jgi:signal transduction histidine kinase
MAMSREEQLASLSAINRRAEGLLHFVESYKKVSGLPEPFLTRVSVMDLINKIGGLLEAEIRSGIKFNILCPDITISVDRGQIEQVIINLLKNAHEAGATMTELMVSLANKGSWLVITVTDNGCGFLPEAEERLFTPFFSTKQEGEGVGLSICKQIITNHGGTIKAKVREDGAGSVFTVRLPL